MSAVITLEVDGKTYYYDGKYFFDESFILLQGEELQKVSEAHFGETKYEALCWEELLAFAKELKTKGLYSKAKTVIEYGLKKYCDCEVFIYRILPVFTSCCREIGLPKYALEIAESYYPAIEPSVALCTSLAAACCDIKNYEKAKWYAKMAYAKQGGGQGYKTELSLVFLRLKKETGESFFDEES